MTRKAVTLAAMRLHLLAIEWWMAAGAAHAAGGHFDVDDATVLAPGRCQGETWFADLPADRASNLHVGPACRFGPVELAVNLDRPTLAGHDSASIGPQIKWVADPLASRLSVGLVWFAGFQRHDRPANTAYGALTWFASESLQVHANLGADCVAMGDCARRWGTAAEWAANDALSLIGEGGRIGGRATARTGLRFSLAESTSVDMSVARVGTGRAYVIGLNHEFPR